MDTGLPARNEAETQGSWIPVTPYRPILPKQQPIYGGDRSNHLDQTNLASECFVSGCSQGPQSGSGFACFNLTDFVDMDMGMTNNWEAYANTHQDVDEVMARWKNVPCGELLALADRAPFNSMATGNGSNTRTDEHAIPQHRTCDLNFPPRTMPNEFSHKATVCEFAPITPEKATGGENEQVLELQNSSTDEKKDQEQDEQNGENATDQCNKQLSTPVTDSSVGVVSTQNEENHNPDKGGTTRQKPRRKKHRPKVITEGKPRGQKPRTQTPAGSKDSPTGRRKYVRKKGPENNSTEAGGESSDSKIDEPNMQSCGKTLIFDTEQHRDENITGRLYFDFSKGEMPSQPTVQTGEGIDVMTPKAVTRKRGRPKQNSTGKRKYVRKRGQNKENTSSPAEPTKGTSDLKIPDPNKEPYTRTENFDMGQPTDENSTCKSNSDSVSELQEKYFNKEGTESTSSIQLGETIDVMTPYPAGSQEIPKGRRKYVRKSKPIPEEADVNSSDPTTLESIKKSCRRILDFDAEGQCTDENSACKSNLDLDVEFTEKDVGGGEVNIDNTQRGFTCDSSGSERQVLRNDVSFPKGQAPSTPLPTKGNPQMQKWSNECRIENPTDLKDQGNSCNGHGHSNQIMFQINSQSSAKSPNDPTCGAYTTQTEQELERGSKRTYCNTQQADASSSNLIGICYHSLPTYEMSWVHNIHKKKRTEKGQNSATPSMLSSVTVGKHDAVGPLCNQSNTKLHSSASKADNCISAFQSDSSEVQTTPEEGRSALNKQQTFDCILALNPTERLTKKRSRGSTRVRDLASLKKIAECAMQTYPAGQGLVDCDIQQVENLKGPPLCREALVAEMGEMLTRKKRTKKRNSLLYSASCTTNEAQNKLILHNHYHFSANPIGTHPQPIYIGMSTIDSITEQFKHLNLNKKSNQIRYHEHNALVPYFMRHQEQNALVLYRRDGTVVPFEGQFDPVKKRRPRPKVELDEETYRVWKLLLEDINSEGIDGTDEEKAKWWEEERRVFRGRVDSFIARMHLVQGDRRFSPWKGSVVDSVVGVFLTQNVSDHLSSSAFMSLAARFPLKSEEPICGADTSSLVEEPVLQIMEQEDAVECNQKSYQQTCDQSTITVHEHKPTEEKEVVSSNESWGSSVVVLNLINESECKFLNPSESREESYYPVMSRSATETTTAGRMCFVEDQGASSDVLSSQNSVVSSLNSMDSSIAQDTERSRSISDSNSEAGDLTNGSKLSNYSSSASFVELLQMAGSNRLNKVKSYGSANVSSDDKASDVLEQCITMEDHDQREKVGDLDSSKDFLGASGIPHNSFLPYPNQDSAAAVERYEIFREEKRFSGSLKNIYGNNVTQQIHLTPDFRNQASEAANLTGNVHEAQAQPCNCIEKRQDMTARQQHELFENSRVVESLSQLRQSQDVTQSSSAFGNQYSTQQKETVSHFNKLQFSKELNEINHATSRSNGKRAGKAKKSDFDWDSLRRQVEPNGKKKERPANTMDSLDYEAMRCTDVNIIANTIKERGMNNMLAERIKDFLNRLVRDHGSIDLEWLRDIPPDKAKEYLLSVRGLGLKSVECVRLLTLHHLAFPVDTNVGRIAVRLGWVPLQPLPESLQLHLLELYPVLESIQKYLWPRLCKLDQKTLYELHYQMITFGKVFCTKSKPNCNACPMRGECRHFASAFASSRLALPGPEEKAIVSANKNATSKQNTPEMINQMPLPLPLPQPTELLDLNHQSGAKPGANNCEPIIEEPATPEPECTEISEKDIEDAFWEDPDEIPTIKLNMEQFTQNLQNYMQQNMELQEGDMSKALVALKAEAASIPTPKLKNVSRLRTEHQVYELPDSHPLLEGLDKREPDDPGRYLLAIWTPGETPNSIQPPDGRCSFQETGNLCDEQTCFSCNSVREANSQIVRGTILIPCRTAMRGSFPLNGTYFQVNEVFADHDSSMNPINVPREWIWNLSRRTVFFGTSVPSIFKGLTTEGIQHCFWRGYVCVRGFDQKTRAPRPLMARLHFPVSKLSRAQGTGGKDDTRR